MSADRHRVELAGGAEHPQGKRSEASSDAERPALCGSFASEDASSARSAGEVALLLLLIAAALALRLAHLGDQSLWVDEANTYLQNYGNLATMLNRARTITVDFPLDRLFQNAISTFPPDEFRQRLPAALFGVLAVPLTYALTRRLWGRRAGLLAAGLLAFAPYHIRYSQEARNYSSFLAFHLLSLICLIDAIRRPSRRRWLAYSLVGALALYDHVYAVVALGLQFGFHVLILVGVYLAGRPRMETTNTRKAGRTAGAHSFIRDLFVDGLRPAWQHLAALAGAGLLFLPWALLVLTADRSGANLSQGFGAWRSLSSVQFNPDLFLRMLRWFTYNTDATTLMLVVMVGAGLLAGVLPLVRSRLARQGGKSPQRHREHREDQGPNSVSSVPLWWGNASPVRPALWAWLTWAYIGLALVGVAVGARIGNNYVGYRRLLFLLPLLCALAGAGLDGLLAWLATAFGRGRARMNADGARQLSAPRSSAFIRVPSVPWMAPALLILALAALSWPAIQDQYAAEKENWRGLAETLRREAQPADLIVNYAVSRESSRALEAYLGPDLAGLHIVPAAAVLQGSLRADLARPATVWQIFPFPRGAADADHWVLNDASRLRTLEGDASLAPLQMMLALERVRLDASQPGALKALVTAGLEQTARVEMPIFSSWRFSAANALTTEYARRGEVEPALSLYRALADHPAVAADVRENLRSTIAYLEQKLARADGLIVGGYWADSRLRAALVQALTERGLLDAEQPSDAALREATEKLAGAAIGPNLVADGEFASSDAILSSWKLRFRNASVGITTDGCAAGRGACLRIVTTANGYQGDLRQTVMVEPGKLYVVRCTLQTESTLGLEGKALYLEYAAGGKTRGIYASAFWGSSDWQTVVALFVPPAGVWQIALSPVLIDNAGRVWLDDVQVESLNR